MKEMMVRYIRIVRAVNVLSSGELEVFRIGSHDTMQKLKLVMSPKWWARLNSLTLKSCAKSSSSSSTIRVECLIKHSARLAHLNKNKKKNTEKKKKIEFCI